jgi:Ca2+-transporting ATPase
MPSAETIYPPPALYFDKNSEALAAMFSSSVNKGLTNAQVEISRRNYGINMLPEPAKTTIWKMIWTQITDFMVVILLIASIVEVATGDLKAAIVLWVVVLINVVIGVSQEYKAESALSALLTLTVAKASVVRDGEQKIIDSGEVVPGDLVNSIS